MHTIEVIGLGAGDINQLPLGIYKKLTNQSREIYLRTAEHPVVAELEKEGLTFRPFDNIYEKHEQFEEVYKEIVNQLVLAASKKSITYAVPGHPMVAERTVQLLLEKEERGEVKVEVAGGQSYLDDVYTALKIDPVEGMQFIDATSFDRSQLQYLGHIIFTQVYDGMIASEVKLALLEDLNPEHPVTIVTAAGSEQERVITVALEDLDRSVELNNLTSVYLAPVTQGSLNHQFFRLREVIRELRGPDGCPWDKKQTHESLRKYLIEEAYEFIDAVNKLDDDSMVEELGDVLLQVMLHSQIGEDEGFFTIDDVILSITEKMIRRHPHVFGDISVNSSEEVITNWDEIKKQEKGVQPESLLDQVPDSFPSLLQAEDIQKRAAKVGFDWKEAEPVWSKVEEEWQEFKEAQLAGDAREMEKELGDLLFSITNLARHYKINAESALQGTNEKFRDRFRYIERKASAQGVALKDLSLDEMESWWVEAKKR
ncbi:MazG family protein [Thalassobacillus devorans]|uniref:MazG family protein n=1 Tax=Thalassobacillus devorans TaxID=279813 RepID=A0ABQ1PVX7_9BACI|nr:nucleoside triphosphate pyrophosphohydrolase [Thalassobacillus devorans]NIK30806.1 tetrapyrrole methylase family protein/MazG family protein [Thalassobacillus devorans]GGD04372.1 MazG family protein [Thalassobacillus devorans]